MITVEDLIDFSELSPDEIEAIAEHTHEPVVVCVAHAETLLECEQGICTIKQYLIDDIEHAKQLGNKQHANTLKSTYKAFEKSHPSQAKRG
jgi:hypothetical protein